METLSSAGNGIVVGLLQTDNSGALTYALHRALNDPSRIRQVRPVDESTLRDPASSGSIAEDFVEGEASAVLLAASRDASVLVIQTPHDEATVFDDPVLSRLRHSAACLLVEVDADGQVVRASGPHAGGSETPSPRADLSRQLSTTLTVGFDGSAASVEAARWAIANAQEEALTVHIVMAYAGGDQIAGNAKLRHEITLAAVERASQQIFAGTATVIPRAIAGEPCDVLLNCAEESRLLVLGRHGTSGMIHSALGSVGDTCARLATCPVVIVPTQVVRAA